MTVRRIGNFGVVDHGSHVNTFEISAGFTKTAQPGVFPLNQNKLYERQPMQLGEFKIVPYGDTNNLPIEIRDILDDSNFAEPILKRRRNLLLGQTLSLYSESKKDNQIIRNWTDDTNIQAWLDSWDHVEYVRRCAVDFIHTDGCFSMYHRNKGARIGRETKIAKLSHVSISKARLGWPEDGETITEIIKGDFVLNNAATFKRFPVFDKNKPFEYQICMSYSNMYSFCRDFYSHAAFFGSINWITLANSIAPLIRTYNKNAPAIRYHIKSPAIFWEKKRAEMQLKAAQAGKQFDEKEFEQYKDKVFEKFSETLVGEQNVGKFLQTESVFNDEANDFESWEVTPLDQKVKDYIDSQIAISNKADSATTSGLSLHPSLSNVMVDGKMASGSEMLYALKLYLATEIDVDESIILAPINAAIKANFPDTKLKLGFYHAIVKTEDSVTSSERTKNKI